MEEPVFIWEPVPDLCIPAEHERTLEALTYVDVISPNLEEFCSLFGINVDPCEESGRQMLQQKCTELVEGSFGCAVVVRLGKHGCLIVQQSKTLIVPAYHRSQQDHNRVVDPTGGGNAFLGGFAVGYLHSPNNARDARLEEAVLYGNVAASFAIEQVGAPILENVSGHGETWNGEVVEGRLERYKARLLEHKDCDIQKP